MEEIKWIQECIKQAEKENNVELVNYYYDMLDRITEQN